MKTTIAVLILLPVLVSAQSRIGFAPPASTDAKIIQFKAEQARKLKERATEAAEKATEAARRAAKEAFLPEDPWRVINGQTNLAKGDGWFLFEGKVEDVTPNGIRVRGVFGKPLEMPRFRESESYEYKDFWIANFPYQALSDRVVGRSYDYSAFESGTFTYTTVNGASRTIPKFDYGKPCSPPPMSAAQKAAIENAKVAAQEKASAAKNKAQNKALNLNLEAADKGDAYGQFRMGERYLKGDGVEKDESKAKDYFTKSAAQGNLNAKSALEKLK